MAISSVKFLGDTIVDNIHGQRETLEYDDLIEEDFRYLISGTSSARIPISPNRQYGTIDSIKISDTRILVAYYDNTIGNVLLRIFDNEGNAISASTTISNSDDIKVALVELSTNRFMVANSESSTDGKVRIYTTTSDTITFIVDETFSLSQVDNLALTKMDDGVVVIAYRDVTDTLAKMQVLQYTISTIVENIADEVEFNDTYGATSIHIDTLTTTRGICFYHDSNDDDGKNFLFDLDGTAITINNKFTFESDGGTLFDTYTCCPNKIAYAYLNGTSHVWFGISSVVTNTINNTNVKELYNDNAASDLDLSRINGYFTVVFQANNTGLCQLIDVDNDYNIIVEDLVT